MSESLKPTTLCPQTHRRACRLTRSHGTCQRRSQGHTREHVTLAQHGARVCACVLEVRTLVKIWGVVQYIVDIDKHDM